MLLQSAPVTEHFKRHLLTFAHGLLVFFDTILCHMTYQNALWSKMVIDVCYQE